MQFYSTQGQAPAVSFQEALMQGLAPDGGLYFPTEIPQLPKDFFESLPQKSLSEIGIEVSQAFLGEEIDSGALRHLLEDALNFEIPLVEVENGIYTLELFHGPTRSFKDVGARFMSRMMGHFNRGNKREITVLVATSGDTGSAVANGFLGVEGVKVALLFPKGKVSPIQEAQMTTLGQNVSALEVEGTFDDCQRMVKAAFVDPELIRQRRLTSANSINIGRLIPQSFYYHYAVARLQALAGAEVPANICVPSGNFGNLTAGLIAERMGLGIAHWIAGTNANSVVPEYLEAGQFRPRASVKTVSNAMDVGNPSNFARMQELFPEVSAMRERLSGFSFGDQETMEVLEKVHRRTGYLMDPHGAVGYLALQAAGKSGAGIFLETAHPAKFGEAIEKQLGEPVVLPEDLAACLQRERKSEAISASIADLKAWLLD